MPILFRFLWVVGLICLTAMVSSLQAYDFGWCLDNDGQDSLTIAIEMGAGPKLGRVEVELSPKGKIQGYGLFSFHFFNSEEGQICYPLKLTLTGKSFGLIRKIRTQRQAEPGELADLLWPAFGEYKMPYVLWPDVECIPLERVWTVTLLEDPANGVPSDLIRAFEQEEYDFYRKGIAHRVSFKIDCGGVDCSYALSSPKGGPNELELRKMNVSLGVEQFFDSGERSAAKLKRLKKKLRDHKILLLYSASAD